MFERIDPIATSESIRENYLRYLITAFGLKNPELATQFKNLAKNYNGLFKGPILEATPKYSKDKSLSKLLEEAHPFISSEFKNYAPGLSDKAVNESIAMDRELYTHQGKAFRKISGQNRNIVVATGTGSGKTECFLLPIIDYLLEERAENRLSRGVRALLLYPMNALANDQVIRLRKLLPPETGITFGRYTGQTQHNYIQGLDAYKQENNNRIPQANELFCRDQILGKEPTSKKEWPHENTSPFTGPPHILLTNFAMLEYLLMRPDDSVLFDGNTWRFIVLDEAHVYSGAQGAEIGYLIRRLKDRVCKSQTGKLLCIATSATIGAKDDKSLRLIADSFGNLFGERFEKDDVVTGEIVPLEKFVADFSEWGAGSVEFYESIRDAVQKVYPSIKEMEKTVSDILDCNNQKNGWPNRDICQAAWKAVNNLEDQQQAKERILFYLLAGDNNVRKLINLIEYSPTDLETVAKKIWDSNDSDFENTKKNLITLVDLASKAKIDHDGATLLSARYHFFVSSLEGVSITFERKPTETGKMPLTPRLIFGRHNEVPDAPGGPAAAFELQACSRCGQPFLKGSENTDDEQFTSFPKRSRLEDTPKDSDYLSIDLDDVIESAEDEEPLRDEKPPVSDFDEASDQANEDRASSKIESHRGTKLSDPLYLCAICGKISPSKDQACNLCKKNNRISDDWVPVRKLIPDKGKVITTCPSCGGQKRNGGSIIRSFSPGDDAAGAVLAQCLFSNIPATSEQSNQQNEYQKIHIKSGRFSSKSVSYISGKSTHGKRRLLAFSDSRQDAAYFASYLKRTSNYILHRQLIVKAIRLLLKKMPTVQNFDIEDVKNPLIEVAQEAGLFYKKDTELTKDTKVSKWLNAELANIQRRQCLEGVGLITWELKNNKELIEEVRKWEDGIITDYGINPEEFVLLLNVLLAELRRQNVLKPIGNVRIQDAYFWPRNRPYTIRPQIVDSDLSIATWFPQSSRNIRSDFIERLFNKIGRNSDREKVNKLLDELWQLSTNSGIFEEVSVNKLWGRKGIDNITCRIRSDAWIGKLNDSGDTQLYKCLSCGALTHLNLKDICPTFKCTGELIPIDDPKVEFIDNHYWHLYTSMEPTRILPEEHTAQISTSEGATRQNNFTNDSEPLNILSCSTTFELGVDVGQLHSVFMRNVPPGIANYVQRAGRAGRRLSAAAYVLTFCRSRPHDLSIFKNAETLISGKVQPPMIQMENTRIARRHLHAVILSYFWRCHHPELFNGPDNKKRGFVEWLFFGQQKTGAQKLFDILQDEPADLKDQLERVFSDVSLEDLNVSDWSWVSDLVSQPQNENIWEGSFGLAQSELLSEYEAYKKLQEEKKSLYNLAEKQIKRIKERNSLAFLASRNVLPKYGFPVDVVSLKIESKDEWARSIELDRDLKIALSEYAPGCSLVANGKVIKSSALEKITGKAWPEYQFAVCRQCGRFHKSDTIGEKVAPLCECGQALTEKSSTDIQGQLLQPVFGFRTSIKDDGLEPVDVRPQRTFASRVYFSHYKKSAFFRFYI